MSVNFQTKRRPQLKTQPWLPFGRLKNQLCQICPFLILFARNEMIIPLIETGQIWPFNFLNLATLEEAVYVRMQLQKAHAMVR